MLRAALTALLFAAAFCAVQRLTFALRFDPFQRTTIWTPGALTCTALLLTPPRRWWQYYVGLCLGVFAAFYGDLATPVAMAMLAAQGHFAAAALSAWVLRRYCNPPPFGNLKWLLAFIAVPVILVTVGTTGPIDVVRLIVGKDDVWPVFLRAALAGFLGILIGTPALLLAVVQGRDWLRAASWRRCAEAVALAACLAAAGTVAFERPADAGAPAALLYAPLPVLLWASMRFGLAGVSWGLLVIACQSTWGAIHGRGPFASPDPSANVLQLQLFLLAVALPFMFLAVVVQDSRRAFEQELAERKRTEEARQELAHASRLALVGELTASIAHEINQPLGAILSNADAAELLLETSPGVPGEVRQILADIRRDDLRASEVIRRLRALLRKREIEFQPVNLNEVIAEVLGLVQAEARRRDLALATDLATDLPPVRGDRIHLQQVFLNLLFNGMEAMAETPGDRKLTVRTARKEHGWVESAVTDTGPGVPRERLAHLFNPFFSTKKEGMGLGLSIARSLVEAHGGRIWAENNVGGGATFRFTLPTDRDRVGEA
jgi:signal transduction histidine kinase